MQCQSYFPVYYSQYDLNADANGSARPMFNGNGNFRGGHYNDYVSPSPAPQRPSAFEKEFVRQTMLMHEVTFKDQVQELHRLYWKQKELMSEIKSKEMYMNHLDLESAQCSKSLLAKYLSNVGQSAHNVVPLLNPHNWTSRMGTDTRNSIKEQRLPNSPIVLENGGALNNLQFPESKAKKVGGKFLDLELPAEVYIDDTEDVKSLVAAQKHDAPTLTSLSSNKLSNVVADSKSKAPSSFAQTNSSLADLNELPTTSCLEKNNWKPESGGSNFGSEISGRNPDLLSWVNTRSDGPSDKLKSPTQFDEADSVCPSSSQKKPSSVEKNSSVIQALPCVANQSYSTGGARICGRNKRHIDDKLDASSRCSPSSDAARPSKGSNSESKLKGSLLSVSDRNSDCSKQVNRLVQIDLNSSVLPNAEFPSTDTSTSNTLAEASRQAQDVINLDGETSRKSKKCRLIDINLPCDPNTEDEAVIEDDRVGCDQKSSGQINLNLSTNDDVLLPKSSHSNGNASEIDLVAPPSPEVEERPPPRRDSEENQPQVSVQVTTPGPGGDPLEEIAKIAAEAIVSISSTKSQPSPESWDLQISKASDSGTLEWFAGLIDSMSNDLENNFEALNHMDANNSLDDFEVMTLNLTEMKAEEYWCKNSVQFESVNCSLPLPSQMRKGRTRRSKRKDFQREVLPSLASLSRYEVTEDIQMIEGLLEAAGTPWHLSRTRRACRMGRKPQAAKQPTSTIDVPNMNNGPLLTWGKANRRPRGRRSPACPSTVLSKWLEEVV